MKKRGMPRRRRQRKYLMSSSWRWMKKADRLAELALVEINIRYTLEIKRICRKARRLNGMRKVPPPLLYATYGNLSIKFNNCSLYILLENLHKLYILFKTSEC